MGSRERHSLMRTSPKGGPFIGTCSKCGKADLSLDDMAQQECVNPAGLTQAETLQLAVNLGRRA